MNKHTFKVGDRVIYTDSPSGLHYGKKGQYWEGRHNGGTIIFSGVKFDDEGLNRLVVNREFFSVYSHASLKHDTDFQVGDWVRYEQGDDVSCYKEGTIGQVVGLAEHCVHPCLDTTFASGVLRANLVKIQPPQEEKMNRHSMKIRNKITGEVTNGVVEVDNPCVGWEFRYEDGSCRVTYYRTHWEPVEEWVKIEVLKSDVGRLPFMTSYVDGDTLSWRYPK